MYTMYNSNIINLLINVQNKLRNNTQYSIIK